MKRLISILVGICCAGSAFAAEPALIEVFGCKLNEGRTMADFNSAGAAYVATINKIPAAGNYFVAVLTPLRGDTSGYDVVWIGSNPSTSDWAKSQTAQTASADVTAAVAAIGVAAQCDDSALYLETPVFEGLKDEPGDNDAVIETYGCNLREGKTPKDAEAFEAVFTAATKALKPTTFSTYRWAPFFGKSTYDMVYLTANDDLTSFAAAGDAFAASKEGRASNDAAAATYKCDSALWSGHTLRQPPAPPNH